MATETGGMQVSVEQKDERMGGVVVRIGVESLRELRKEVANRGFLTPADWQPVLEAISRQLPMLLSNYDPDIHSGEGYIHVGLALKSYQLRAKWGGRM